MSLKFVNLKETILVIARFMHVLYQKCNKGEITFEKHETSSKGLEAKSEKYFNFVKIKARQRTSPVATLYTT